MATTSRNIIPSKAHVVINQEKTVANFNGHTFNRDSIGVPYYVLKFKDKANPFALNEESFVFKAKTIVGGQQINYSQLDDAAALALAKTNGFISPTEAVTICNNASTPFFVKFTEDEVSYEIAGRQGNAYSRIYPIGTSKSVFMADMKQQGIEIVTAQVVHADDNDPFGG